MTLSDLAKMASVDRGKLGRFEDGKDAPSGRWISGVERALDSFESETGHEPSEGVQAREADPIRLTFHDVYGIGEIIAEAPGDKGDELVAAVVKLLTEIRANKGK